MAIRLKNHTKGLELWRGLSRYDSDLLLGLRSALFFLGIGSTTKVVRVPWVLCGQRDSHLR